MKKSEILKGALLISDETGHGHVRDIESDIFSNPGKASWPMVLEKTGKDWSKNTSPSSGYSFSADYEGDTLSGEPLKQNNRLTKKERQRYNNMSITRKKNVRDIKRDLSRSIKKLKKML